MAVVRLDVDGLSEEERLIDAAELLPDSLLASLDLADVAADRSFPLLPRKFLQLVDEQAFEFGF